ncbi:hypothetical protein ACOJTA_02640 [Malaciobacter sp. WC5094]
MTNLNKNEVEFLVNILKCIPQFEKSLFSSYMIETSLDNNLEEVINNYYKDNSLFSHFEIDTLRKIISKLINENEIYLNDDEADILRDICTDTIDLLGYDKSYNLTEEGIVLNQLIDKLYIE